jgi:NADPH:quinone reductase-like Zn-dependent oxidoreductase
MHLEEVPTPEPGPGEVLIEVHAVTVNRTLDLIVRSGKYARRVSLPHVPGVDPCGVIAKVGPGVTDRKVGDRVAVMIRINDPRPGEPPKLLGVSVWGGYAEYVKVPAAKTRLIPDDLDFVTAAVVARHAPQAFHMLRDHAKVKAGNWVLVMGAAGGLGSAGVQVAKHLGAQVIAAAGADTRVQAALTLGADAGVNYRSQDLQSEVLRVTGGRGVDVVFENVGDPDLFPKAFATLVREGRLVTAGGHAGGVVPLDVNRLYLNQISIMGVTGERPEDFDAALKAAAEGRFKALIECVLPLSEAQRAHTLVADRNIVGKVVLDPRKI